MFERGDQLPTMTDNDINLYHNDDDCNDDYSDADYIVFSWWHISQWLRKNHSISKVCLIIATEM